MISTAARRCCGCASSSRRAVPKSPSSTEITTRSPSLFAASLLRPAELRWRAGQLGETYVPPAEMKAALEYVGRSAAALSQTLHVPPLDHEQQHNVQDGEHL